jgi:aldehyde dehydrogenase (NAD+)
VANETEKTLKALLPAYCDQDCIRVVTAGPKETTQILKEKFDYIFYTGNPVVGKIIMRQAAENLTPLTLELGGKSPCIIDKDVEVEVVAKRIAWAKFANAGQVYIFT